MGLFWIKKVKSVARGRQSYTRTDGRIRQRKAGRGWGDERRTGGFMEPQITRGKSDSETDDKCGFDDVRVKELFYEHSPAAPISLQDEANFPNCAHDQGNKAAPQGSQPRTMGHKGHAPSVYILRGAPTVAAPANSRIPRQASQQPAYATNGGTPAARTNPAFELALRRC
ncbi:hypothetical protein BU26DRAFT_117648 [Trematosphaeria pertusa]|uniref:Uncharacterized protein n=1 Tax=Trematosphaeria pertusa TaxID=390896 RepID=A0A6A6I0D1_9PLEO|nr:uncharacterized protein BU26DRAFT_117648 [Trematosphaeria pertusa]KAF2243432.1 hypothetical protein BU26DRAFT_117648 [Trematosphaeria pertusa]